MRLASSQVLRPLLRLGGHVHAAATRRTTTMAHSKYEYVRNYELPDPLLPGCWVVVRLDGKGFTKWVSKIKGGRAGYEDPQSAGSVMHMGF